MNEYISKQAVLNLIDELQYNYESNAWGVTKDGVVVLKPDTLDKLREAVKATPPADVAPVYGLQITREDDKGVAVLNWAVRYALGRSTYAPGLTMDVIRPMLPDCSTNTVAVFVQDVGEWLDRNEPKTGSWDNYWADWKAFLDDCKAELKRREDWPWHD